MAESLDEPMGYVSIGDRKLGLTRRGSEIVKYVASFAMYDHVLIEDEMAYGILFRSLMPRPEEYDMLDRFMEQHNFTRHLHVTKVPEGVMQLFEASFAASIDDKIPESWE